MDRTEAASLLHAYLAPYRRQSHGELQHLFLAPVADEVVAPSGKRYQVVVQAVWVHAPGGELRVVGGIDDKGWQRFSPLTDTFAVRPARDAAPAAS